MTRRPPILLYRGTCPKCRFLSSLARGLTLGGIRRVAIGSRESEVLCAEHPRSRGRLAVIEGPRVEVGVVVPLWLTVFGALAWGRLLALLTLVLLTACGSDDGEAPACPINQILEDRCTCGAAEFVPDGATWICDGEALARKESTRPLAPHEVAERCNGLDDDLDGATDEDEVCATACSQGAVAAAIAGIELPTATTRTVAVGSGVMPLFSAVTEIPAWCLDPRAVPGVRTVGCGEVLNVDAAGLEHADVRVAPGGVLRFTGPATVSTDSLLLCPLSVLQAGGSSSMTGDGEDGHDVHVEAEVFLHFGAIETHGGTTREVLEGRRVGDSGEVRIAVDRWLFSGTIDTSGASHPDSYAEPRVGGAAGYVHVEVALESFVAGSLTVSGGDGGSNPGCGSGGDGGAGAPVDLVLPVCCHGLRSVLAGGNGGNAGVGEDSLEGMEPAPIEEPMTPLSLCDGEDRFLVTVGADARRLSIVFAPDPGEDIDLELHEGERRVAWSEGVGSREDVRLPGAGTYGVRVYARGEVQAPGAYMMVLE